MISVIASLYWLLLALTADAASQSKIKQNYPEIGFISVARERFLGSLTGVTDDASGLVAGLTIGVRDLVSDELQLAMRDLSLTHLVAVSGANLAIVMGVVYLLTSTIGLHRNYRFALAFVLMLLYVVLVGPESSVIRAAVMATFVAIGLWLGRGSAPIHGLALAILLLLLVDPALSVDIGFALSALATAGLLILAPVLFERFQIRMNAWLAAGLAATIAAQLYTLPVLLILQPSLPVYSVLANLIVEPAVAPITILGIVAVLLASLIPPLAPVVSWIASIPAQWIVVVANQLSDLPLTRLHFLPGAIGIGVAILLTILITLLLVSRATLVRKISAAGLTLTLVLTSGWLIQDFVRYQTFAGQWQVLVCDVGQGDALLVRSQGKVALVDVGRDEQKLLTCLVHAGVDEIDTVFLTHFDLDHVGAIRALRKIDVSRVLVSGFSDDRPVVDLVASELLEKGLSTEIGHVGVSGLLGRVPWHILAPTKSASEAVDSNDASLVTLFDFGNFALLGLGDLGEHAQSRLKGSQLSAISQLSQKPLVLKVAHHGSKDQLAELAKLLSPELAIFSVGKNDYGHPTKSALDLMAASGAIILRTDLDGSIAIGFEGSELRFRVGGKLSA